MQILYGYLLLCSPVRYRKAFKVALRSSLIFSCKGREAILSCDQHTKHLQKGHMMFTNRLLEKCKRELTVDLLRRNASASSTKSSSLVQCERISFIFLFMNLCFFFFIYSTINITHNAMSPTHDDSCSPSQTLYAWPSRHHVPWVPRRRQS